MSDPCPTCPTCGQKLPATVIVDAGTVIDVYELHIEEWRNQKLIEETEPITYVCVERTAPSLEPARERATEQTA